jgi:Immunity protein 52
MNAQRFLYGIWLVRPQRRETPAVIGQKFLDTLDALSVADPFFTPWKVLDSSAMAALPLATARPRIASIVENNVVRNDSDQPEPQSGYSTIALTDNPITSRIANLTVRAGAVALGSNVMLAVGDPYLAPTDPAIVSYPRFRQALLAMSALWQPAWSYACAFRMDYWKTPIVSGAPVIRYNPFHITWIAYLSPKVATGLVVPPAEVRTEHAPGGGILLSATEEDFDTANPDHLRRAHLLAETMIAQTGDEPDDDNPGGSD